MVSEVFIHLFARDNNRMRIVSVVANLTFVDGGSLREKKKYHPASKKNGTNDSMAWKGEDIHRIQVI